MVLYLVVHLGTLHLIDRADVVLIELSAKAYGD